MKVQTGLKKISTGFPQPPETIIKRMITKVHRNIINFQKKITKVQTKDYKIPKFLTIILVKTKNRDFRDIFGKKNVQKL